MLALCLFRDQLAHIKPIEQALNGKVDFVYDKDWNEEKIRELLPDIVIGINEYHLDMIKCYQTAKELGIPTLTIQDGILEWRFMFENDLYKGNETGVPMHHPIIADKYACIGLLMAHHIAQLGNAQKVEITGMPKLDDIGNHKIEQKPKPKLLKKILIITSSKPWFDDEQKITLLQSLHDLKSFFDKNTQYEPNWRITKGLELELGVSTSFNKKETAEIKDQINECDAVITTTSTTIIESMLLGKPVATLDYFNRPVLTPTVWNIRQKSDIKTTLDSIQSNDGNKNWMQEDIKNQLIRTDKPASLVVADLIVSMIDFRKNNLKTEFPMNMTNWDYFLNGSFENPEKASLYINREVFNSTEINWLQVRLARAERENEAMRKQLNKRTFGHIAITAYGKLKKLAKKK